MNEQMKDEYIKELESLYVRLRSLVHSRIYTGKFPGSIQEFAVKFPSVLELCKKYQ